MFTFYFSLKCQLAAAKYVLGSLFNFLILKIQERKVARLSKGSFGPLPIHFLATQKGANTRQELLSMRTTTSV